MITVVLSVVFTGLTFATLQPLLNVLFYGETMAADTGDGGVMARLKDWMLMMSSQHGAEGGKRSSLLFITLVVVGLNILGNVFRYLAARYMAQLRTGLVHDLRRDVFESVLRKSVAQIENRPKGDLLTRLTSDVSEVENSVIITLESLFRDPFTVIFFLVLMILSSWQLTLFIFILLPISAIFIGWVSKALRKAAQRGQHVFGNILSLADEAIMGVRVVKAFNGGPYIRKIFSRENSAYRDISRYSFRRRALVHPFSETMGVITVGVIIYYGGGLVFDGEMQAGSFIAYVALFSQILKPARSLSQAFGNINRGVVSGERLFSIIDEPVPFRDSPDATEFAGLKTSIEFQGVGFRYSEGGARVLRDINLSLEKGKVYALVGPSGSGKTTLAELLLRFYDVSEGEILLDGTPLRGYKLDSLRQHIAVVTQEPILFNDSVLANITFGMEGASLADVRRAAIAAHADEFIMNLAEGYDTKIGDRGGLLSGGQRQRLSIARAILRNPDILILDEATSALDSQSEGVVQAALEELMRGRTSLVIAHRLSTIRNADKIIVVSNGGIIEQGSHDELLEIGGAYAGMIR